jgi:hypothetical protein
VDALQNPTKYISEIIPRQFQPHHQQRKYIKIKTAAMKSVVKKEEKVDNRKGSTNDRSTRLVDNDSLSDHPTVRSLIASYTAASSSSLRGGFICPSFSNPLWRCSGVAVSNRTFSKKSLRHMRSLVSPHVLATKSSPDKKEIKHPPA